MQRRFILSRTNLSTSTLRIALGAALGLLLIVVPSLAGESRVLEPSRFKEQLRDKVPVSGGIRKGVFMGHPDQKVGLDRLRVEIPATERPRLCVEIESQDGAYSAELEYRLERPTAGGFALRLPSHYASFLENLRIRELAVLAYLADACPGPIELIVPAIWGTEAPGAGLTVLVNSQDAEVRILDPETRQQSACRPAPGKSHLSYDTECTLESPRQGRQTLLVIDRRRYETRLKPIQLTIYMP
jgi:hypothetical protein